MKIALILGPFSVGARPIDMSNLWDNSRGLTGTDLCFIRIGEELEKLGHQVVRFLSSQKVEVDASFDVALSINEPNLLMGLPKSVYKVCWHMLNDFTFIPQNFDQDVDLYLGVCEQHTKHLAKQTPKSNKWKTLALGCDPELYQDERIPGRVLWCSSADRGLHWLLQQWSQIKERAPEANLRILYHFNGSLNHIQPLDPNTHPHVKEMAQRLRYIKEATKRLTPLGVELVGSVSRNQMVKEWNQASVFGFSCDTVAFSEGFSISTLEAHASFTVPVITAQDCLGGIYQNSGACVIPAPVQNHLDQFTNSVVRGLTDPVAANEIIRQCRGFALQHTWTQCAVKLQELLQRNSPFTYTSNNDGF